jgi:hypothetical protein
MSIYHIALDHATPSLHRGTGAWLREKSFMLPLAREFFGDGTSSLVS